MIIWRIKSSISIYKQRKSCTCVSLHFPPLTTAKKRFVLVQKLQEGVGNNVEEGDDTTDEEKLNFVYVRKDKRFKRVW